MVGGPSLSPSCRPQTQSDAGDGTTPRAVMMSTSDRLARLRQLRYAWQTLRWSRMVTVPMPGACCAYELVGGIFARRSLHRGDASPGSTSGGDMGSEAAAAGLRGVAGRGGSGWTGWAGSDLGWGRGVSISMPMPLGMGFGRTTGGRWGRLRCRRRGCLAERWGICGGRS